MDIDFEKSKWERLRGYVTELRVDARWILKHEDTDKPMGSLRIVAHPDLAPGYLRAIFTFVVKSTQKSLIDKMKTTEDYMISMDELEAYSIDDEIITERIVKEAPFKELESIFGVKVFKKD